MQAYCECQREYERFALVLKFRNLYNLFVSLWVEDDCLLGCCVVYSGRNWRTFQRCLLPPSVRLDDGGSKHLLNAGQLVPDLYGATSQKTVIFILVALRTLNIIFVCPLFNDAFNCLRLSLSYKEDSLPHITNTIHTGPPPCNGRSQPPPWGSSRGHSGC
jgi:hypothetical protein